MSDTTNTVDQIENGLTLAGKIIPLIPGVGSAFTVANDIAQELVPVAVPAIVALISKLKSQGVDISDIVSIANDPIMNESV